jgi:hypothetical protein
MDLIILFQQRKEAYPEEFAPEIVFACTEYEYEERGGGEAMKAAEASAKANPEITAVKRFRLRFPDSFRIGIRQGLADMSTIPWGQTGEVTWD